MALLLVTGSVAVALLFALAALLEVWSMHRRILDLEARQEQDTTTLADLIGDGDTLAEAAFKLGRAVRIPEQRKPTEREHRRPA